MTNDPISPTSRRGSPKRARGAPNMANNKRWKTPADYTPDACTIVVALMAAGLSLTAAAGAMGVSGATIDAWIKQHDEFREAVSRGKAVRILAHENQMLASDNAPVISARRFSLLNAAPDEWREKQIVDPDRTPQLAKAALIADRHRVPERLAAHGRCHRALVGARLKDSYMVDTELRQLLEEGNVGSSLRCSHDPYAYPMPDAQGGIQSIMTEMLAYSRPGVVEVLPALPPTRRCGLPTRRASRSPAGRNPSCSCARPVRLEPGCRTRSWKACGAWKAETPPGC